jgi:hypothetical protein
MPRITIFKESTKTVPELADSLERYLSHLKTVIGVSNGNIAYHWNSRKDQLTITNFKFSCQVLLTSKGIVVIADLPIFVFPYKQGIESLLRNAVNQISSNGVRETQ